MYCADAERSRRASAREIYDALLEKFGEHKAPQREWESVDVFSSNERRIERVVHAGGQQSDGRFRFRVKGLTNRQPTWAGNKRTDITQETLTLRNGTLEYLQSCTWHSYPRQEHR
jgi:hypothetical protein